MLFHVSEDGGIERFEPCDIDGTGEELVWAIDADVCETIWFRANARALHTTPAQNAPAKSPESVP